RQRAEPHIFVDSQAGTDVKASNVQRAHEKPINDVTFSPRDGKYLASASDDRTVKVWDEAGKLLVKLEHEAEGKAVAFSPEGQVLAACTGVSSESKPMVGTVIVWDWVRQSRRHTLSHPSAVNDVAFSPDGQRIATGSADGTARIWNAQTEKIETEFL